MLAMYFNTVVYCVVGGVGMFLGFGGVYVLISSFHDDDGDEDGEKYIFNFEHI